MGSAELANFSSQQLERVPILDGKGLTSLILDKNSIHKLENLELYIQLQKLSVGNNKLQSLHGLRSLFNLTVLNLPGNLLTSIEGLSYLSALTWLNLSGNKIKTISNLEKNRNLRHLDLSDNKITQLGELGHLIKLKTLLLHGNRIASLSTVQLCLPASLEILSLAENYIDDLNEVSYLACLPKLEQLSIMENPCVSELEFDYRPFILNWCVHLRILNGLSVTDMESLKAEWLLSQGRGRHFQPGQHYELCLYLKSTCPLHSQDEELVNILKHKQRYQKPGAGPEAWSVSDNPSSMKPPLEVVQPPLRQSTRRRARGSARPAEDEEVDKPMSVLSSGGDGLPVLVPYRSTHRTGNVVSSTASIPRALDMEPEAGQSLNATDRSLLLESESQYLPVSIDSPPSGKPLLTSRPSSSTSKGYGDALPTAILSDVSPPVTSHFRRVASERRPYSSGAPSSVLEGSTRSRVTPTFTPIHEETLVGATSIRPTSAASTVSSATIREGSSTFQRVFKNGEPHEVEDVSRASFRNRPLSVTVANALNKTAGTVLDLKLRHQAACCIQRFWRGYYCREHHPRVRRWRREREAMTTTRLLVEEKLRAWEQKRADEERIMQLHSRAIQALLAEVDAFKTWRSEVAVELSTLKESGSGRFSMPSHRSVALSTTRDTGTQMSPGDMPEEVSPEGRSGPQVVECGSCEGGETSTFHELDATLQSLTDPFSSNATPVVPSKKDVSLPPGGSPNAEELGQTCRQLEAQLSLLHSQLHSLRGQMQGHTRLKEELLKRVRHPGCPLAPERLRWHVAQVSTSDEEEDHSGDDSAAQKQVRIEWDAAPVVLESGDVDYEATQCYQIYLNGQTVSMVSGGQLEAKVILPLNANWPFHKIEVRAISAHGDESYLSSALYWENAAFPAASSLASLQPRAEVSPNPGMRRKVKRINTRNKEEESDAVRSDSEMSSQHNQQQLEHEVSLMEDPSDTREQLRFLEEAQKIMDMTESEGVSGVEDAHTSGDVSDQDDEEVIPFETDDFVETQKEMPLSSANPPGKAAVPPS